MVNGQSGTGTGAKEAMKRKRNTKYSRGRWMIECERCGIPRGTPPPAEEDCATMDAGVEQVLKGLGLSGLQSTNELVERWEDIVGSQVARHSRPGRMNGSELIVYVDSSVWLHELQRYGLKGMYAKVKAHCDRQEIKSIRLQLDPDRK